MKKIALVISLFIFAIGSFAQTSTNAPESVSALKEKVAKLEAQIREDAQIIRVIRSENRALKKELRKLRKAGAVNKVSTTKAEQKAPSVETPQPKVEKIETEEKVSDPKESSVWDNIFPF